MIRKKDYFHARARAFSSRQRQAKKRWPTFVDDNNDDDGRRSRYSPPSIRHRCVAHRRPSHRKQTTSADMRVKRHPPLSWQRRPTIPKKMFVWRRITSLVVVVVFVVDNNRAIICAAVQPLQQMTRPQLGSIQTVSKTRKKQTRFVTRAA